MKLKAMYLSIAQIIEQLQAAAKKNVEPMTDTDGQDLFDPQCLLVEQVADRKETREATERKKEMLKLEQQYHDELKMELQGITDSASLSSKGAKSSDNNDNEANQQKAIGAEQVVEVGSNLEEVMMSRKKRKLLEAIKIGKKRKQAKVHLYEERKRKAKEGKEGRIK